MKHIVCDARIQWVTGGANFESMGILRHYGSHDHECPPVLKLDCEALDRVVSEVLCYKDKTPKVLQVGDTEQEGFGMRKLFSPCFYVIIFAL